MALYMNFYLLHTVDCESFAVSDSMDNVKFNARKLCALLIQIGHIISENYSHENSSYYKVFTIYGIELYGEFTKIFNK